MKVTRIPNTTLDGAPASPRLPRAWAGPALVQTPLLAACLIAGSLIFARPLGLAAQEPSAQPPAAGAQTGSSGTAVKQEQKIQKKERGPGKEVASGGADIGKGAGEGAVSMGKGAAGAAGDLVTLHPVDAGASLGKGAAGLGEHVGVGTVKGGAKIGKGTGKGIKHLLKKIF